MRRNGLETYRGNYSAYLLQRQERWERRQQLFQAEVERLDKEIDFIRRNISGGAVSQARGRLRRLSRYLEALEQIGLEGVIGRNWGEISEEVSISASMINVDDAQRRLHSLRAPSNRPLALKLKLKPDYRSGEIILRTRDLAVGYPNKLLFKTRDVELRRLECAALIGPNGAGKTTFLKTILQQISPLQGEVTLGASLKIGYFAQAHEGLDPDHTAVQEIEAVKPSMLLGEIRDYLARFLFTGDDVFKLVAVLSGGERGRLALAKLSLMHANLLLLDEPTNHLDIPSQEILQQVLAEFQGTILLVSHDRYLINVLATQLWEIDDNQGVLRVFQGTYSEYSAQKEAQRAAQRSASETRNQETRQKMRLASRSSAEERQRQERLRQVEDEIDELEGKLALLSRKLENPPSDTAKVQKLGNEYVQMQKQLENLLSAWEALHR
jgi:ATP-binding cassette subfamily F protein 3